MMDHLTPGEAVALCRHPGSAHSLPTSAAGLPPVTRAPVAAGFARAGGTPQRRVPTLLCGDHILTVRRAVAATLPAHQPRLTERVLAGEADHLPLMRAAYAVAERVLGDMFS